MHAREDRKGKPTASGRRPPSRAVRAHSEIEPGVVPHTILALQRAIGNRAVSRIVDEAPQHEVVAEARAVAERDLIDEALASPSRPLADQVRAEAESFYQSDLSPARVHEGPVAQRATEAMGAAAMTIGTHIFLPPAAARRKDIVGHELSHVKANINGVRETGYDNGARVVVTKPGQDSELAATADGAAFADGTATAPSLPGRTPGTQDARLSAQRSIQTGAEEEKATVQRHTGAGMYVQRYDDRRSFRNSTRSSRYRHTDPGGRTRDSQRSGTNPMDRYRQVPPPRTVHGRRVWDGTRRSLGWQEGTRQDVLNRHYVGRDRRDKRLYECPACRQNFHASEMDIDHIIGIIAYVVSNTDENEADICLDRTNGIYRTLRFVWLDDAIDAANDPNNLRALCYSCNRSLGSTSGSRHMDTTGATWAGEPYQVE